jgi:hypothetical protein
MPSFNVREMLPLVPWDYKSGSYQSVTQLTQYPLLSVIKT